MNKTLIISGILSAFAALPANAHEWSSFDRNKNSQPYDDDDGREW